jgi:hypothetical protein
MSTPESDFSRRLLDRPDVASRRSEHRDSDEFETDGWVAQAVKDQLLVTESAVERVLELLQPFVDERPEPTARLLEGMEDPVSGVEDVFVFTIDLDRPGRPAVPGVRDIFDLVDYLRRELGEDPDARTSAVSANHIAVPASPPGHTCPWGPPHRPPVPPGPLAAPAAPPVNVTVIDAGYMWGVGVNGGPANWGRANPLDGHVVAVLQGAGAPPPGLDMFGGPGNGPDRKLDALAGHANFTAGVIARLCPNARITIRNHGPVATELEVLASFLASVTTPGAKLVHVGYAFPTGGQILTNWLLYLRTYVVPNKIVVTAPAGNQGSRAPQYPAALSVHFSQNMLGVAALDHALNPPQWTNRNAPNGPRWVTCSARGVDVDSTFLVANMPCEDGGPAPVQFDGWARWNGTSFTAPKIIAHIANALAANPGLDAVQAWANVSIGVNDDPEMGLKFDI